MRTFFAQVETRYRAIKDCPFIAKVFGGYMCFESESDYRVWKNQGYCEIQYIQNYLTKIGYTERKEGWAADIFELPEPYNTGYAPFGIKSEKAFKVCKRWNELYCNYNFKQK